jgi:hypothetical protein
LNEFEQELLYSTSTEIRKALLRIDPKVFLE